MAHEFCDTLLRELHDELPPPEHRKNLSVHLETVGGHHLSATHLRVVGEGFHDGHEPRVDLRCLQLLDLLLCRHNPPRLLPHTIIAFDSIRLGAQAQSSEMASEKASEKVSE